MGRLNCDNNKRLITLASDYIKRFSLNKTRNWYNTLKSPFSIVLLENYEVSFFTWPQIKGPKGYVFAFEFRM